MASTCSSSVNPVPAATIKAEESVPIDATAFAEQVAEAKQNVPAREEPRLQTSSPAPVPVRQINRTPSVIVASEPMQTALLPTVQELRADGTLALPDLHVDIHVYSEVPTDRFVFINMNKYNEGSRLAEGPVVKEITTDGVVLDQGGTVFLVPRD